MASSVPICCPLQLVYYLLCDWARHYVCPGLLGCRFCWQMPSILLKRWRIKSMSFSFQLNGFEGMCFTIRYMTSCQVCAVLSVYTRCSGSLSHHSNVVWGWLRGAGMHCHLIYYFLVLNCLLKSDQRLVLPFASLWSVAILIRLYV